MIKIYADTSVFGGCFDTEFREWSEKLIKEFKVGLKVLVLSDLTLHRNSHSQQGRYSGELEF